jgi:hypothetical protein
VLNPEEWDQEGMEFGAMPLVIHLGDFMQLRPFEMGLADSADRCDQLHKTKSMRPTANAQSARKMFLRYTDTFILEGNKRFLDKDLPLLLNCMRAGKEIPPALWQKIKRRCVNERSQDGRLTKDGFLDAEECGVAWETVNRWMTAKARRDAHRMDTMLYVIPSIDAAHEGPRLTDDAQKDLWMKANINTCGKLAGTLKVHIGQKVRLSQVLSKQCDFLPETEATIADIVLDPREEQAPRDARERVLQYHPIAIYLRFCAEADRAKLAELKGLSRNVIDAGLFPLAHQQTARPFEWIRTVQRPRSQPVKEKYYINRVQFPIMPSEVRTVHAAQGRTFRRKAIMDLGKAQGLALDAYWLNLYTMLSRPTRLQDMLLINLPDKKILEAGPPDDLKYMLIRFEREAAEQRGRSKDHLTNLRWVVHEILEQLLVYVAPLHVRGARAPPPPPCKTKVGRYG